MISFGLNFYSPDEALPKIPQGKFGVSVIVVTFDSCYDELVPGKGYEVYNATYSKIDADYIKRYPWYAEKNIKEDFMILYLGDGWGHYGPLLADVKYWAYMPEMVSGKFI